MSGFRVAAAAALAVVIAAITAPTGAADTAAWNGRYRLFGYAAEKAGTSIAARQPESTFSAEYVVVSMCSGGQCVATLADGPTPTNPTIPHPLRYKWDGTQWGSSFDWQWECFQGDGQPVQFSAARSWTFYAPQPDGSLRGRWYTDILSGPCRGNVIMPVAAFPVR